LFCPKCGIEFPPGESRCPGCNTVLLADAAGGDAAGDELVELLKTADMVLLEVVKSMLDSAGIPYLVQGEGGLRVLPLGKAGGFFSPSALGAVVRVQRRDLADATRLLEETTGD
jgi:hypothetical protein